MQILPDANDLVREAIHEAVSTDFDGIPTRVFTAEHLCAVALQTGRTKDYLRVVMFLEANALDRQSLEAILKRHQLGSKLARVDDLMKDSQ